ncbi:MAG: M48 family metallopeptidase, partial [Clostridia bacterium]|nr:M48 family metallopeptidase [Clostridia bacterium]
MLALTGIFILAYIYFTLFPGKVPEAAWQYFNPAEVARARQYQQIMRLVSIIALLANIVFLVWLVYSTRASGWAETILRLTGGSYFPALIIYFAIIWLCLKLIGLPFSFYSSFIVQHQWGFSTQSLASWWSDYLKSSTIDLVLSGSGVMLLFWATGRWPQVWWAVAGLFLSGWLLVSTFLWPLLVAPLFNTFQPINEGPVKSMVTRLADRAGINVKEVLVMDASRRTTKINAYFSGLGTSKRIVIYDNLLNNYPLDEVEAVLAHEMAHWKQGHIIKGILWGIVANFCLLSLLYLVLKLTFTYELSLPGPYLPQLLVAMLLFWQLASFLGQPLQNNISRRYEVEADRLALEYTANSEAMVRLQVNLARHNLSDITPPAFIEWLTYSHPPALK